MNIAFESHRGTVTVRWKHDTGEPGVTRYSQFHGRTFDIKFDGVKICQCHTQQVQ